jgi:hypothetical protein
MQAIRSTLVKIEAHARAVAIGVTTAIALGALAWPYLASSVRYYVAGAPQPRLVLKPGYQVLLDGHRSPIFGTDECPQDKDPQKAYWLGGRPKYVPSRGCVVVGPATTQVRVRLSRDVTETWKVIRQERDGLPVTLVQRPNGEYVADTK